MSAQFKVTKTKQSRLSEIDFQNIPFGKEFSDHMFVADYRDGQWQNMEIVPFGRISIHPAMMGLHYGQSIFEGMKATVDRDRNPLLFRPELHARRFNASARRMRMPEIPEEIFLGAIHQLVDLDRDWIPPNMGSAMYIRPIMFATDEFIGVRASKTYKFIIFMLPVGPYYERPVSLVVERKYVRAVKGGSGEAKAAGNYGASLLPAEEAIRKGYDQVLWMDPVKFTYIQEVGTMNVFFVFKDKVVTPITDGAILKGITRKSIIQLLRSWDITVEERLLSIEEVKEAYKNGDFVEVFGSGTAAVIAAVNKVVDTDLEMTFDEPNWTLSRKLKSHIDRLRNGLEEDTFGWIVPVHDSAEVSAVGMES